MQITTRLPGISGRIDVDGLSPRAVGFGLVVLLHVVFFWALATGFVGEVMKKMEPPPVTIVKEAPTPPVEPLPPIKPTVALPSVDPILMPEPLFRDAVTPPVQPTMATTTIVTERPGAEGFTRPTPAVVPTPIAKPAVVTPGAICTKMGKPEAPSLNWAGEATIKVAATVKAGRVVNIAFQSLQGPTDSRSRRALQAAVTNALQDTYECPGDHQFEQEFHFKIE